MNKILVSLAASLAVLGLGFAQVPGGIQEAPRPGISSCSGWYENWWR